MKKNNFMTSVFNHIKHSLIINRNELDIKQKRDRFGNSYWQVYDPKTNNLHTFASEKDVRVWIETRHFYA